ncbi:oxidoreductase [Nonomuraea rhodomycinica]|uniref:SDR family NAD(P)-dependent oxidoreductase n=1 Tax=Nonomuraea rhodomycinica TaxID=1712872 RepID=A0A7Y6IWY5_9ACTN|nr:oxidoreductase [Nonomuraea rhodomycinica]NUW45926.1 SDR family NAD(P)-dependent oxidoreductase [Nonomuraea rhodomycinica]
MAAKICLVTGASSGIGHATALELLRAGHVVYGAARRVERMAALRAAGGHVLEADVTSEADAERAVRTVLDERGRVDVLVNNAGAGLHGAIEDVPVERARRLFEVNLFGAARLTQLVLPGMRERRSGRIVNVSSVAGRFALPMVAWYHASKHALEAFSDALRQEVRPFGIKVVVVEPGLVRTEFEREAARELRAFSGSGAYRGPAEAMARRSEGLAAVRMSDPAVVARTIRKAVEAPRPRLRYPTGHLARPLLAFAGLTPDRLFDRMVTRIG